MKNFSNEYLELLRGEFAGINLTRIEDPEEFYNKQILDSLFPLNESKVFKNKILEAGILVDIGFGGGFPILPLAKNLPKIKFFGFDARSKKVEVVKLIAEKLRLNNVKLAHARVEDILFDKPVVITLKAVGKISDFLPLIKTTEKILVCFYKGPKIYELEELDSIEKSWELVEEIAYDLNGTEGRTFLCFRNKNVLRGTINNKLIKFSGLL
jgi:16S rRNA (guanine527-N7)-methyltransferase